MENTHRIVSNHKTGKTFFRAVDHHNNSFVINDEDHDAFISFLELHKTKEDLTILYKKQKQLFDKLYLQNIITDDLQITSPVRKLYCDHHLKTLQIETLLKCNLSCSYCYCEAGKNRTEYLSTETIELLLRDAEEVGVLHVDFTGGEFLLRADWKKLVRRVRSLGMTVSIHTNAMALNKRNVDFLASVGVKHVQLSADSHVPEIHNEIRGHANSFDSLVTSIMRLRIESIPIYLNLMCHDKSVETIKDSYDFYSKGLGVSVIADWVAPFGSSNSSSIGISLEKYIDATQKIPALRNLAKSHTQCGREMNLGVESYEPACGIGYSYLFITATGEMAICPTLTSRENGELFNGPNINDMRLGDAWHNHPYFRKFRHVNCSNVATCVAGPVCKGGCRANAYARGKNVRAPDLVECNRRKNPSDEFVDFEARYKRGEYGVLEQET